MKVTENSFSQAIIRTQLPAPSGERDLPLPPVDTTLPLITISALLNILLLTLTTYIYQAQ